MNIKTKDLIGQALDWAVTKLELEERQAREEHIKGWVRDEIVAGKRADPYSTDWMWGGPIIEANKIAIWTPMAQFASYGGPWVAGIPAKDEYGDDIEVEQEFYGPTPLIAAMRCYVWSKMGDEVEVPEGLLQ